MKNKRQHRISSLDINDDRLTDSMSTLINPEVEPLCWANDRTSYQTWKLSTFRSKKGSEVSFLQTYRIITRKVNIHLIDICFSYWVNKKPITYTIMWSNNTRNHFTIFIINMRCLNKWDWYWPTIKESSIVKVALSLGKWNQSGNIGGMPSFSCL